MIVEWIVLDAFGPFRERRFALAPGFTVVHGANEAGKSTLHAALVTGLCGVRRARGRAGDEREFEERHRPWSGTGWKLRLGLRLADDRRIELIQDLDHKEQCRAYDAVLGRDVTHEIASGDWTPDATRWLGIDRRAFVAMASVRQSELRALRDHAGALREFVQRAVATAGADGTAATAIDRIDVFLREHVGARTAHSTKPLRRAQQQLDAARAVYERARADHDSYLHLVAREEEHTTRVARATTELALTHAARALSTVAARREVVDRVRALQRLHPDGPPAERASEDLLARDVDRALQAWASRPAPTALVGPSAAELRREYQSVAATPSGATRRDAASMPTAGTAASVEREAIPLFPVSPVAPTWQLSGRGEERAAEAPVIAAQPQQPKPQPQSADDHEPSAQVRAAAARFEAAREQVRAHARLRPQVTAAPPGGNVTQNELQRLAERLGSDEPMIDMALDRRVSDLEFDTNDARRATRVARASGFVLLAIAIVGAAIVAGSTRWIWLIAPALVVGTALLEFALAARRNARLRELEDELQQARDERHKHHARHEAWEVEVEAARERALELALPPDGLTLRRLADDREHWDENRHRLAGWQTAHTQLERDFERLEDELRVQLRDRGIAAGPDLSSDVAVYEKACQARVQQRDLAARIEQRTRDELVARQIEAQCDMAAAAVIDVARRCGFDDSEPEQAIAPLQAWLDGRGRTLAAADKAQQEWSQLETLRAGRSLFDLENDLSQAEVRAAELARGLDVHAIAAAPRGEDEVARRQRAVIDAELQLARLRTELERHPAAATPIADAEDDLRAAEMEMQRVETLEETLHTAQRFLVQAQERVHRDVAPLLAGAVRAALPVVTSGRWVDARVDPESMEVAVQDTTGQWRRAAMLSHGTAEQVYLLLRAALVRHLVRRGESCPLFLDDATVQFDRDRKRAALDTLYALSRDRQVVVFTQEDAVLEWARAHLVPSTDAVIALAATH